MTEIYRGKQHSCTIQNKIQNVIKFSGAQKKQVTSTVLKDITNSMATPSSSSSSSSFSLKRVRGAPLNIILPTKKAKLSIENSENAVVDSSVLKKIRMANSENESQTARTAKILREEGIKVKWGAITEMKKQSHELDRFFSVEMHVIDVNSKNKKSAPIVFCSELNALVSYLISKREINGDFLCKLGIDGGGGSLKVSIFFSSYLFIHCSYVKRISMFIKNALLPRVCCPSAAVEQKFPSVTNKICKIL